MTNCSPYIQSASIHGTVKNVLQICITWSKSLLSRDLITLTPPVPVRLCDQNTTRSDRGSHTIVHNSSMGSAHRARCAVPGSEASSPAPLLCLAPRPRFKIRLSRTRPAPKVSIVVSRRTTATNPNNSNSGAVVAGSEQGRGEGPQNLQDGRSAEWGEGVEGRAQEHGVWYQLVCARLAGLKGCESLAS